MSTDTADLLSYDDTVPYEELPPAPSILDRIGKGKLYLLSETLPRKRKAEDDVPEELEDNDVEMDSADPSLRANALFIRGKPISSLSTEALLSYALQHDSRPLGIEWVDDVSCIIVFSTKSEAVHAQRNLQRVGGEEPDEEGFTTAKPVPISLWPAEERINRSLGNATASPLKGVLRFRWARVEDVKQRGAKQQSEFYKKHGLVPAAPEAKRRRTEVEADERAVTRATLDEDLDRFLADGEVEDAEAEADLLPPSKMRSDWIDRSAADSKSLLERTSAREIASLPRRPDSDSYAPGRVYPETRPPPRRRTGELDWAGRPERPRSDRRGERPRGERTRGERGGGERGGDRIRGERTGERPKKSQVDLDAELDAFLSERT